MVKRKNNKNLTRGASLLAQPKSGIFYDDKGNKVEREYYEGPNGTYYTYNDDYKAVPIVLFDRMSPEELEKWRQTAPNSPYRNTVNEVQKRQALMRAAGYDVPNNGLWTDEQQALYDKLTTKNKDYDTTLKGFLGAMEDKLTGNTTYRDNPLMQDEVKTYDPNNVDWDKTNRSHNKFINAVDGTWGPIVMTALGSPMLKTAVSAPLTTAATLGGGALGGWAVNKASEAITGKSIGDNVAKYTSLSSDMGELLNPGYGGISRGLAVGDALTTAITGKSRSWMKPLVREYLGKPYYANIRPSGYGNSDPFGGPSRNRQYFNMFVDFLKPTFLRGNVNDPDYRPKWMADRSDPTVYETFRNDAHRLSMGLKPHQELLPDNQYHSLYIKKPDGKYDVDWGYINNVKEKYPDKDFFIFDHTMNPRGSESSFTYHKGRTPSDGSVVANDFITLNGGYGTYTFNPNKVHVNPKYREGSPFPSHASTGDVRFTDTWDVQPLIDSRSAAPWLSKSLTKVANKKIPVISKWAQNLKNVELVDALGGTPFTQESMLPNQTIFWFPED